MADDVATELREEHLAALERLRVELTGSLEERQKQRRMEELAGKAARRMGNQGLVRGWTAWHEQWEEAARQRRMLAAASARLARPALAASLGAWLQSWHEEVQDATTKGHQQVLREQSRSTWP